jgi:glycosyltransferase involved in cell wall biosynthesis
VQTATPDAPDYSLVLAAIPCHNEVHTVASVVEGLARSLPGARIVVVDNGSTDGTARAAIDAGAEVMTVVAVGKGNAVRAIFAETDRDVVLLIDGDATYDPADAPAVVRPVLAGEVDMAVGERMSRAEHDAFLPLRRTANRAITWCVNALLKTSATDVLSGYRALSRRTVESMRLASDGFEIETEILCEVQRLGVVTTDVPVRYDKRHTSSRSKLLPMRDALRILATAWRGRTHARR